VIHRWFDRTVLCNVGRRWSAACLISLIGLVAGCGDGHRGNSEAETEAARSDGGDRVVNVYAWDGYFDPAVLERFTAETGIAVNYQPLESNDVLLTKLLTGKSGYDVVTAVDAVFGQEIRAGVLHKIDKSKIENWKHLDPHVLRHVEPYDPGNEHGVPFAWGTDGIGYNEAMVRSIVPDAPVDSWRLVFDPAVASRFAKCGIAMIDSTDLIWLAQAYLGQQVGSNTEQGLKEAEALLLSIRPYIRMIDNASYKSALADGEVCIAVGWSYDIEQARLRAVEAGNGQLIKYSIPKEGSIQWVDMMAIPLDAPNVDEAHEFIDFMQRPEVAAANTNFNKLANGNRASDSMIAEAIRRNESICPATETRARLFTYGVITPEYDRLLNRAWTRVRTGR